MLFVSFLSYYLLSVWSATESLSVLFFWLNDGGGKNLNHTSLFLPFHFFFVVLASVELLLRSSFSYIYPSTEVIERLKGITLRIIHIWRKRWMGMFKDCCLPLLFFVLFVFIIIFACLWDLLDCMLSIFYSFADYCTSGKVVK